MPLKSKVKKQINAAALAAAKRSETVDELYRARLENRRRRTYQEFVEQFPQPNDKTVVFNSFGGRGFNDNPKAIYNAMINDPRFDDWRLIWVFKPSVARRYRRLQTIVRDRVQLGLYDHENDYEYVKQIQRMHIVTHNGAKHFEWLARAKYWVSNQRTLDGLEPTDRHEYIQTWHGTPFKRLGVDVAGDSVHPTRSNERLAEWYRSESRKWNYTIAQNDDAARWLTSAFQLEEVGRSEIMHVTGYPRNDKLVNYTERDIDRVYQLLGLPRDKKIALYTPTYRDDQHTAKDSYVYELNVNFRRWERELRQEWVILFRPHYLVAKNFDFSRFPGFVYDVSSWEDINDLYLVSDVLINDYSSTMFDYSILRRPMMFYCYDLEHYESNLRGFYFPSEELPGRVMNAERQVIDELKNFEDYRVKHQPAVEAFAERYAPLDDGRASQRIVDQLFS